MKVEDAVLALEQVAVEAQVPVEELLVCAVEQVELDEESQAFYFDPEGVEDL
jgi:hypothetical protein